MELKGLKVNFLGDSITQGVGATDQPNLGYVGVLRDDYGIDARNYGITGTRVAQTREPTINPAQDQDFCGRALKMDDDADVVIVFGGTNDFGQGYIPLGSFNDQTPFSFYGALHTLYVSLINKYPTKKIVAITPLHRIMENRFGTSLSAYVNAVREVAEWYSIPVLDLYANLGANPNVPIIQQTYMPDGLHPNNLGHKLIAEKIAAFLRAM